MKPPKEKRAGLTTATRLDATHNGNSTASETARIHRACNLLADSAIAADDAVAQNDPDAVDNAIRAVKKNSRAVCKLCLAWRSHA